MLKREGVVITGVGILSPLGNGYADATRGLLAGHSGIREIPAWREVPDLTTHVAGILPDIDLPALLPRRVRRSMGRVAQLCAVAAQEAVAMAKLSPEELQGGGVGVAVGSTTGSPAATLDYYANILGPGMRANKSTSFLQVMSHTCAANLALTLGTTGRVWGPASACTSASQAIGLGYETLLLGAQDVMICGGAEEVHYTTAGTFNLAGAASTQYNQQPEHTPRPFDAARDGMVVAEGAGILILERESYAKARGATILGRVLGFATTCDAEHITSPSAAGMERAMRLALKTSGLNAHEIDYINAHATGTLLGDAAEAAATAQVFGDAVPISSTKSLMGHALGACGAMESIFILASMAAGVCPATRNLENVDAQCQGLWHLKQSLARPIRRAINNNFAFGGINTSLVFGAPLV